MHTTLFRRGVYTSRASPYKAVQRISQGNRGYAVKAGRDASPGKLAYVLATGLGGIGAGFVLGSFLSPLGSFENTAKGGGGRDTSHITARPVPLVAAAGSVDEIEVASPVRVLSLHEANDKLREGARIFEFGPSAANVAKGRVDVVRIASNSPVEDEWAVGLGHGVGSSQDSQRTLYAGIYDGHAGWATSAVLKNTLIRYVSTVLGRLPASADDGTVSKGIQTAFESLDERIMELGQQAVDKPASSASPGSPEAVAALAPAIAGSCALLAVYDPSSSTLRTALTGDSRAVLGTWSANEAASLEDKGEGKFLAEALTLDQTGFNAAEVSRLDAEHPDEMPEMVKPGSGRLFGLAVTRAFGDHRWKWPGTLVQAAQERFWGYSPRPNADRSPPYVTARPEVTTRRVQPATDFVILASDGLWDVMSSADAVTCVERWLAARKAAKPEETESCQAHFTVDKDGYSEYKSTPDVFAIEDLDNAAVCLAKNAFGGRRRDLFRGIMTAYSPVSRYVRDDVTIQVIFFQSP